MRSSSRFDNPSECSSAGRSDTRRTSDGRGFESLEVVGGDGVAKLTTTVTGIGRDIREMGRPARPVGG